MRLDNVPLAAGLAILAALSHLLGFSAALPWGIAGYFVALAVLVAYVARVPVYDHARAVPPALAILGLASIVSEVYLLLRLWLWAPHELWFLHGQSWLGAILTLGILTFAPSIMQPLVFATFRGSDPLSH